MNEVEAPEPSWRSGIFGLVTIACDDDDHPEHPACYELLMREDDVWHITNVVFHESWLEDLEVVARTARMRGKKQR